MSRSQDSGVDPLYHQQQTVTSTEEFEDQTSFLNHVLSCLKEAKDHHRFVFTEVPQDWGRMVIEAIDERTPSRKTHDTKLKKLTIEVKPTKLHTCVQSWIFEEACNWAVLGLTIPQERGILALEVGRTLTFSGGPYNGSRKEPDFLFSIGESPMPTFAVETGYLESLDDLHDDMKVLLIGGNGLIKVVLIVKWIKNRQNRISGILEVFKLDSNGMPVLKQTEVIFPEPQPPSRQLVEISREELFGTMMVPGRNSSDRLPLDMANLRRRALSALKMMGLRPE